MPFVCEPNAEIRLKSLEEAKNWAEESQDHLRRVSIKGILENQAIFHDDEYLGDDEVMLRFNEHSIRHFCQRLGFLFDPLAMIETPLLPSQVLNDLIQQSAIKEKLENEEFVVDTRSNIIMGIVSQTYVGYSNRQFLEDIKNYLNKEAKDEFQFQEAFGINTDLTIRFYSEKRHGIITGRGGEGEDRTLLGFEFRNSMAGTSAVRINYYLFRLVCANGMMVPAGNTLNRVFHSGNLESFNKRIECCFGEVMRKIESVREMIETLGKIPLVSYKLASNSITNQRIFEIIPALKQTICDKERLYLRYPSDCPEGEKKQIRLNHDSRIIDLIPKHFGREYSGRVFNSRWRDSATIFDFLNVFTEYAKLVSPSQKLDIEEKTGSLARHIAENAKKF